MRVSGWKLELAKYCCQINHQDQTLEDFAQKVIIEEPMNIVFVGFLLWHKAYSNAVVVPQLVCKNYSPKIRSYVSKAIRR